MQIKLNALEVPECYVWVWYHGLMYFVSARSRSDYPFIVLLVVPEQHTWLTSLRMDQNHLLCSIRITDPCLCVLYRTDLLWSDFLRSVQRRSRVTCYRYATSSGAVDLGVNSRAVAHRLINLIQLRLAISQTIQPLPPR